MPKFGAARKDGFRYYCASGGYECWLSPKVWKKIKNQKRAYDRTRYRLTGTGISHRDSERGTASELFVESELLRKGFSVGRPSNRFSKHDLFVKAGAKWLTVQIKTGQVSIKTGNISLMNRNKGTGITSDVIAVVDLEGHRIRWMPNAKKKVPKELI